MHREPSIAIGDVLGEIAFLRKLVAKLSFDQFKNDSLAVRGAAYAVQTISEAVRHIPAEWLADFPQEPWSGIRGAGNKIRHEYFRLNEAILWEIIQTDCPSLEVVMYAMLARHPKP
jgi:uncharacterized protein with HEPN domain